MNTGMVTGAGSGVGREVSLDLVRRGWRLLLPARSPARVQDVVRFAHQIHAPKPQVITCDLSDHRQVRQMCADVGTAGELDVVINCAGVGGGINPAKREVNAAGVELRMAVNAPIRRLSTPARGPQLSTGWMR